MIWLLLFFALVAGAFITLQTGVNAQMARAVGHPMMAALISFATGTAALAAYCLALRLRLPAGATFTSTPWWLWTGGLLGAFIVSASIILAPRLGAAVFVGVVIGGQLLLSLLLDHYGLLGFAVRPLNLWRVLGAMLLVAGVVLIRRF